MNCSVKGWFAKFDYLFVFYITYIYISIYLYIFHESLVGLLSLGVEVTQVDVFFLD